MQNMMVKILNFYIFSTLSFIGICQDTLKLEHIDCKLQYIMCYLLLKDEDDCVLVERDNSLGLLNKVIESLPLI